MPPSLSPILDAQLQLCTFENYFMGQGGYPHSHSIQLGCLVYLEDQVTDSGHH